MRRFLLITSILVAATSAQAMQTRGLVAPGSNTQTAQLQVEPNQSVADQLKAIGEAPKPAASEQASAAPAPAPAAPVATPAATSTQSASARAEVVEPATKPVKKAKAQRRETDEQKARRIAARYGISW